MADKYAVFGNPIAHSKSPEIHHAFAQQTQQDISYDKRLAPIDALESALNTFIQEGGQGANITVPFKLDAYQLCESLSVRATAAGAVNTLILKESGQWHGDNTDGIGLQRDIEVNQHFTLQDKRVLLLGAGGAVRGVLQPLLSANPSEITISNRTLSKAEALAEQFQHLGKIHAQSFAELQGHYDLIINGTASGLTGDVPPISPSLLHKDSLTYDMMYGSEPTAFVRWGQAAGAMRSVDGLGMLIEQAAESFHLWRGVRPDTQPILTGVRASLSSTQK